MIVCLLTPEWVTTEGTSFLTQQSCLYPIHSNILIIPQKCEGSSTGPGENFIFIFIFGSARDQIRAFYMLGKHFAKSYN